MRSQMACASGRMPLRVRMNFSTNGVEALSGVGKRLLDPGPRGATGNIVTIEHGIEFQMVVDVFAELGAELAEFFQGQRFEFDTSFHAQADGVADDVMSAAKGHTFFREISG